MNPDSTKYLERYIYLIQKIHQSDIVGNPNFRPTKEERAEAQEKGKTIVLAIKNYLGYDI